MTGRHEPGIVDVQAGNNTQSFELGGSQYTVPGFAAGPGYDLAISCWNVAGEKFGRPKI